MKSPSCKFSFKLGFVFLVKRTVSFTQIKLASLASPDGLYASTVKVIWCRLPSTGDKTPLQDQQLLIRALQR